MKLTTGNQQYESLIPVKKRKMTEHAKRFSQHWIVIKDDKAHTATMHLPKRAA